MAPIKPRLNIRKGRGSPALRSHSKRLQQVVVGQSALPKGAVADLNFLDPAHPRCLQVGVDYGTDNSSAAFLVAHGADESASAVASRIRDIRTDSTSGKYPTVAAVQPTANDRSTAMLIFGQEVFSALQKELIKIEHIIKYPKLALIDQYTSVFQPDRTLLEDLRAKHKRTINFANSFDKIRVCYAGAEPDVLTRGISMKDINICMLKWLRYDIQEQIKTQIAADGDAFRWIWENKTQVAFAAPTFWTDEMLDAFMEVIQAAGFPPHCNIFSEPKCALSAHIANTTTNLLEHEQQDYLEKQLSRVFVVADIGCGSLDTASMAAFKTDGDGIRFKSIVASGGSLCGGHRLDGQVGKELRSTLETDIGRLIHSISMDRRITLSMTDFVKYFDYETPRRNFDASAEEYLAGYIGPGDLTGPHARTARCVCLSNESMTTAHEKYIVKANTVIKDQITRTEECDEIKGEDRRIHIVLAGGVTRSVYVREEIKKALLSEDRVAEVLAVEAFSRPLVPVGAIIALGQPSIASRFRTRQSYGTPVAVPFDRSIHYNNRWIDESADQGVEARDVVDWIINIGDPAIPTSRTYALSCCFMEDDDRTPSKSNPIYKDDTYPIVLDLDILSTSNTHYAQRQDVTYLDSQGIIEVRKKISISLTRDQCIELHQNSKEDKVGFWRDSTNGNWFFGCKVRVILDWPDVRLRWSAEVARKGDFDIADQEGEDGIWKVQTTLTSNNYSHKQDDDIVLDD